MGALAIGWRNRTIECPLAFGDNTDRLCAWCGTPLAGRRRRWCSDACAHAYSREHAWTDARAAALGRDGHRCVRCGADGTSPAERDATVLIDVLRWWFGSRRILLGIQFWTWRDREAAAHRLEVNHRTPILGRHAETGCHHHLDGLETLCRPCHLAETRRQFGSAPPVDQPTLAGVV